MAARTGVEARTAPATPARQSRASMSATAPGRFSGIVAGETARATPAALAIASAPGMRVVFFVARAGKPRSWEASGAVPFTPRPGLSLDPVPVFDWPARPPAVAAKAAGRRAEGGEQAGEDGGGAAHQAPNGTKGG